VIKKIVVLISAIMFTCVTYCNAGESIVIATSNYAPFTSSENNGSGVILDVVKKAFQNVNVDVEYQFHPWKRCEYLVQQGKAFAATPYFKTDQRMNKYDFSVPIVKSFNRFFYNKEKFPDGYEWETLKDFKGYTMGGILGLWYMPKFKKAGLKIHTAGTDLQNLKMLIAKRIDFTVIDELTGKKVLNDLKPEDAKKIGILDKPESVSDFYLMVSRDYKNHSELNEKFTKGFKMLKESGEYMKILSQYQLPEHFAVR